MLLQLAVTNFKSIADKVVLSFLAVEGEEHPEGQVVDVPGVGGVLRSIVVYGANASGKSTLVWALMVLRALVVEGARPEGKLPWIPNDLAAERRSQPTSFEVEMVLGGARYSYGLVYDGERVLREWLVRVEHDSEAVLFEREEGRIEYGPGLQVGAERSAFLKFVAEGTRPNQVFLAELRERAATEFAPIQKFFQDLWTLGPAFAMEEASLADLASHGEYRAELSQLLAEAGTGVASVVLEPADPLLAALERLSGKPGRLPEAQEGRESQVRFVHLDTSGAERRFSMIQLSEGTRRLIDVSFWLFQVPSSLMVIDELERSLHTQLTKWIIARWNASSAGGQAIFTTHDTNLLDAKLFGRDAIWFVEKDRDGASHFYSLVEFDKEQLDKLTGRLEDGYLQGRFGAVPFAGDPTRLGWSKP